EDGEAASRKPICVLIDSIPFSGQGWGAASGPAPSRGPAPGRPLTGWAAEGASLRFVLLEVPVDDLGDLLLLGLELGGGRLQMLLRVLLRALADAMHHAERDHRFGALPIHSGRCCCLV